MHKEIMDTILAKIKEYDTIIIFRHFRPDGDAKGSTKGLQEILRLSFPEKNIHLIHDDHSEYLAFLGDDDADVADEVYASALGIVLDTATSKRIGNQKFNLCKEIIKIDHHLDVEAYGHYNWVDTGASSVCEMVAKFYATYADQLKINSKAATAIYTGMVTDSGRFQYSSVSGDTMRYAGVMLDQGIDTDVLFAQLYLKDFEELKFKSHVYKKMKITENGVAYVYIDKATQEKFQLSAETASTSVGFMDSIKGCLCWIAFIDNCDEENTIRVRLRSRFAAINTIAEQYRGGGHACACGATVLSKKEMKALVREADALIKDYKDNHEGWL
jgi:phosphoesterase RecJ-like protein